MIASLDWELSTTGNPLADLAFFLMPLYCPPDQSIKSFIFNLKDVEGNAKLNVGRDYNNSHIVNKKTYM